MKKEKEEIKKKHIEEQAKKIKEKKKVIQKESILVKEKLIINEQSIYEEKREKAMRVRQEKYEALNRKRSTEKEFLQHINYQYHIDRKEKIEEMKTSEEQLKKLEEEEH